jgi:hypothetical protein
VSDSGEAAKAAWVAKVLGLTIPASLGAGATTQAIDISAFRSSWAKAVASWRATSEQVDTQISDLQVALRETDDQELHQVADAGLNGITGNHKVPLLAALQDVASVPPDELKKTVATARQRIAAYMKHLQSDPRIGACDRNPLGVPVSIKATLVPALQVLSASLSDVT